MTETKLEPCPFCGMGNVEMHPNDLAKRGGAFHGQYATQDGAQVQYAHCNGCGAEGPQAFIIDEAIAAWNRRKPPSTAPSQEGEKTGPIREEMARALEKIDSMAASVVVTGSEYNQGYKAALTVAGLTARVALSKHRDRPPAHRSGK